MLEGLLFTTLQNDERGGRDALYPVHEPECPGDCDANRTVAVNELVHAVNIALDSAEIDACSSADRDRDMRIRVDELVTAVRNALAGCLVDREILAVDSTSHEMPLPLSINRGTIRLEVVPAWEPDQNFVLVDFREPQSLTGIIQLIKRGPELHFIAMYRDGTGIDSSMRIDDWTPSERHEITVTWTYTGNAIYVDGELSGEAPMREPLALPLGSLLRVGIPAMDGVLENVRVFGRP
jgi:hypothetical protein